MAPLAAVDAYRSGVKFRGARGDWLIPVSEGCGKAASENMEPICSLETSS